jgi:NDP-sugar pyrophosphorylase family protein
VTIAEAHHNGRPHPDADPRQPKKAIVLAGGLGTRLAPYTSVLPKPLMPIGDRAILEIVVDQLGADGFTDVTFCVGHLAHLIRAVFDSNGRAAHITYVHEKEPLGTAGPLRLIGEVDAPFIVMNGDVLTTINYRELVRHHQASGNVLTIAAHPRRVKIDYGVLELDGGDGPCRRVGAYIEKPESQTTVSMGVYVVDPRAIEYVPRDSFFDFPDLVQTLLRAGERVGAFVYDGMWFDIGRPDDYQIANAAWIAEVTPNEKTAV